ncbi:MAG: glycosyltransferase family 4 protein [Fibrobacterota bacterium]|nr:glycosyltransferase family 4 protein [Fibrobacterota bacterium]
MTSRPILFVTRNFPPTQGGIETFAAELARHGLSAGEPMVLVHVGQPVCDVPPSGLLAYHHLPGTGRWPALLSAAFFLPWFCLRHRPRLIVNMQVTTGLGSMLARVLLGVPYIVLCMGLEVLPGGIPLWRALRGSILRRADHVISISRFTDSLVASFRVHQGKRQVITPGTRLFPDINPTRDRKALFGAGSETAFVVLSLSRLVPRKGIDKGIEAIALVAEKRPDILYCIAGSGPDLPRLRELTAKKGVEKNVRFMGRIAEADMGPCFARADLFLLPSRSSIDPPDVEGFGIVFLEAGACGTPSLGGNSGGVPDAVLDGETGFLVDPEDPQDIAEKILRLMEDRELLRRLGAKARAHSEDSTWEKACARYFSAIGP